MRQRSGLVGIGVGLALIGATAWMAWPAGPAGQVADDAPPVAAPVDDVIPAPDPIPWQGVTWAQLRTAGLEFDPGQGVRAMAASGDGLIAHGRGRDPRAAQNPDGLTDTAIVWTSHDGTTWRGSPIVAGVRADSVSELLAIAAGPRGVVAVGGVCCREERPAVWWSADGGSWERSVIELARGAWFADTAASGAGFVVVGGVGDRAAIWTSPDGRAWTEVDAAVAGLVRGRTSAVAPSADGFVAAGIDDPLNEDSDAAIWASRGLADWRRVAGDDPAFAADDESSLDAIIPFAGGLFAVGGTGARDDRLHCENLLGGALLADASDTALSCGWLRTMTWRAAADGIWTRVDPDPDGVWPPAFEGPPPGRAPISWHLVTAGGPGLVAFQEEAIGPRGDGENTTGIWTSTDGVDWTRLGDAPGAAADLTVGLAVDGRRLLLLSEQGHAWVGTVTP